MIRSFFIIVFFATLLSSCIESAYVRESLTHAEALIEEHPDSALSIIKAISPESISSRRSRALYALLMTRALDKNYVTLDSDTLISRAVDYFEDSDDLMYLMQSRYYLGIIKINTEAYAEALLSFTKAHEIACELNDNFWIAMTARSIADIYHYTYNSTEELKFAKISLEAFKKNGKHNYTNYSLYDLIRAYISTKKYDAALEISKLLIDSLNIYDDESLYIDVLRSQAHCYLNKQEYNAAKNIFSIICNSHNANTTDSAWFAMSLIYNDNISQARTIANNISNINPSLEYSLKYEIYTAIDSPAKAMSWLRKMNDRTDLIFQKTIQHNLIGSMVSYLRYENEIAEREQIKTKIYSIIIILIIIASGIFIAVKTRRSIKLKNDKIAQNISIAQNLRNILSDKESQTHNLIDNLLKNRFDEMNRLCQHQYDNQRDPRAQRKKISDTIEDFIKSYSNDPEIIRRLELYADQHFNGIITDFYADFEFLKPEDKKLFLYSSVGFSNVAIFLFLQESKITDVYERRRRLKDKIKRSNCKNQEKYLSFL